MKWAILLASNQQGVGKSTLGMDVLGPLVGETNVSVPSEANVVDSSFNGWQANKRLAIVNEIYSGQSWKAYNKLKSSITDPKVTLNEKYIPAHSIANWIHIFACSNSDRALKLEDTDRRWFVPTVTEQKWPDEKFDRFHIWLKSGGLSIIKDAAEKWDKADYVKVGEPAPDTKRKQEMVYDSLSPAMSNLYDLVAAMKARETSTAVTGLSLMNWLKKNQDDRMFDTLLQFRKAATKFGLHEHKDRVTIAGRTEYLLINPAAKAKVDEMTKGDFEKAKIVKWLKETLTPIDDIIPPVM
ncbi:MAG: hypothetical protein IOC65_08635 [Methylobacterium sp.]|nr:hypothetical protein [Methylobacterium sp.]MCA3618080.1 hypothetical protein [Methylobacterium sp.]